MPVALADCICYVVLWDDDDDDIMCL